MLTGRHCPERSDLIHSVNDKRARRQSGKKKSARENTKIENAVEQRRSES